MLTGERPHALRRHVVEGANEQRLAVAVDAAVQLIDERDPEEFDAGHVEGAINLPLPTLRERVDEVPRGRPLWLYCAAGQRACFAQRLLMQNGFDVRNLSGGNTTWLAMRGAGLMLSETSRESPGSGHS